MNRVAESINDNDELIVRYEKAKAELDVSLKLYRLVIIHGIESEIPKMYRRVKKSQAVYEDLYKRRYPFGGFNC